LTPKLVKSAERVLLIFEYFALIRRPATASEIEVALELPQSSTSALLHSLTDLGYLEYLPEGRRYRPTVRIAIFSDWLKPSLSANLLTERLDELQKKSRETVLVGRLQGNEVHYVHILLASRNLQFYMREGTRRPLCMSAAGRALLSTLSDQSVRRITRSYNAQTKARKLRVDEDILLAMVKKIRQTGISETDPAFGGEHEIHAIATLMPRNLGTEQFTLGVAGPRDRILRRRTELITTLREWMEIS
jgi:DNA-binding IclR family transcriptional regulator